MFLQYNITYFSVNDVLCSQQYFKMGNLFLSNNGFQPGNKGGGRPKGSRNKITQATGELGMALQPKKKIPAVDRRLENPGRQDGSRNNVTLELEKEATVKAVELLRKMIAFADHPDPSVSIPAMKFVLERLMPPRKSRPVHFSINTQGKTAEELHQMSGQIITMMSEGQVTPDEAHEVNRAVFQSLENMAEATRLSAAYIAIEAGVEKLKG